MRKQSFPTVAAILIIAILFFLVWKAILGAPGPVMAALEPSRQINQSPHTPNDPTPDDGAANVPISQKLSWQGGDPDGDPVTYTIAINASGSPPVSYTTALTRYMPSLVVGAVYSWAVIATDGISTVVGVTWSFTTVASCDIYLPLVMRNYPNEPPDVPANPSPPDGATERDVDVDLSWTSGDLDGDSVTYDVYFEASNPTPALLVADDQASATYDPGDLDLDTPYYWQIVARDEHGAITPGPVWVFTTTAVLNNSPHTPFAPVPADGAINQPITVTLGWTGGDLDGDGVTYDVYFEANDATPDVLVADDQAGASYDPGTLNPNTHYCWQIVAVDEHGATTTGPVWDFVTGSIAPNSPPNAPSNPAPAEGAADQGLDVDLIWTGGDPNAGDTVTYDVYLEANDITPDVIVADDQAGASHNPGTLQPNTHYCWQIVAQDSHGATTAGPVWDFTTGTGILPGDVILIATGEFQMGCDPNNPAEGSCPDDETLHTVNLDAYTIDKYEVTNAQYVELLNALGNQSEGGDTWLDADDDDARIHLNGSVWKVDTGYEDHPVTEVTWYGARAYCTWLGRRLPSEAEWEKAARGSSDTRKYPWGDDEPTCLRLNYANCLGHTTPVGSYPTGASPYRALDMAGNVWEWVNDWYQTDYYDLSPYSNPPGPDSGDYKVLRGGSFHDGWRYVRAAGRSTPTRLPAAPTISVFGVWALRQDSELLGFWVLIF